jgi:hypothetical protein
LAVSGIAAAATELLNRTPFNAFVKNACLVNLSMAECLRLLQRPDQNCIRNDKLAVTLIVKAKGSDGLSTFLRLSTMPESGDEERSLMGDQKKTYGVHSSAASRLSAKRSWRQVPSGYSSRAGSDSEDYEHYGNSSRHKRPALSTLSSFINSRHSDTPNLVLPALDPR